VSGRVPQASRSRPRRHAPVGSPDSGSSRAGRVHAPACTALPRSSIRLFGSSPTSSPRGAAAAVSGTCQTRRPPLSLREFRDPRRPARLLTWSFAVDGDIVVYALADHQIPEWDVAGV